MSFDDEDPAPKKRPGQNQVFRSNVRQKEEHWTKRLPWSRFKHISASTFRDLILENFAESALNGKTYYAGMPTQYEWDMDSPVPAYKRSPIVPWRVVPDAVVAEAKGVIGPVLAEEIRMTVLGNSSTIEELWEKSNRQTKDEFDWSNFDYRPAGTAFVLLPFGDTDYQLPRPALYASHQIWSARGFKTNFINAQIVYSVRLILDMLFPQDVIVIDSSSSSSEDEHEDLPWYEQPQWRGHELMTAQNYDEIFADPSNPRPYAVSRPEKWQELSSIYRPYHRDVDSRTPAYYRVSLPSQVPQNVMQQLGSGGSLLPRETADAVDYVVRDRAQQIKNAWIQCNNNLDNYDGYNENTIPVYNPGEWLSPEGIAVVAVRVAATRSVPFNIIFPRQALYAIDSLGLASHVRERSRHGVDEFVIMKLALAIMDMAGPDNRWKNMPAAPPRSVVRLVPHPASPPARGRQKPARHAALAAKMPGFYRLVSQKFNTDSESEEEEKLHPLDKLDFATDLHAMNIARLSSQKRPQGIDISDAIKWYKTFNAEIFQNQLPPPTGAPDLYDHKYRLSIVWSDVQRHDSGLTATVVADDGKAVPHFIMLNSASIGRVKDMQDTLAHEMCHAAADMLGNGLNEPSHGPSFTRFARMFDGKYGNMRIQEFCDGMRRFLWECEKCLHRMSTHDSTAPTVCRNCKEVDHMKLIEERCDRLDGLDPYPYRYECKKCGYRHRTERRMTMRNGVAVNLKCIHPECGPRTMAFVEVVQTK